MSIFNAMVNSVMGLRAQSFALQNISDNIANSQTVGYKRVDTSFEEMVADYPLRRQVGGAVASFSRGTNALAGTITATNVPTNFALNGPGFVTVRQRVDNAGGVPTFSATNAYTRRGDFELDKDGYLVNGTGHYLVGYPIDPGSGNLRAGSPDVLKIAVSMVPAKASSVIDYSLNLPSTPQTPRYSSSTPGSDIWTDAQGAVPALVDKTTSPNAASFANNSIDGGALTMYDSKGSRVDVQFRWAKVKTDATTGETTWGVYFNSAVGSTAETSSWQRMETVVFDKAGLVTSPTSATTVDMSARGLGSAISIDFSKRNVTQFATQNGRASVQGLTQNGYPAGQLDRVSISDDGRVMANFSNGQSQAVAQIAIAQFNAPNMLKRASGGAFEETLESGTPLFGANGTSLVAGALEGSNTDIADEFSKMIVTQQAYSANTRVVTTAQQMLQDVINIVR